MADSQWYLAMVGEAIQLPIIESVLSLIIQVFLISLLIPSYFFALTRVSDAPFVFVALFMLIFDRIFSIDDDEARMRRLLAIENISIPIFSLLIVVNVAYFGLWGSEFVQIWSNILLVTIILGVATLQSGMRGSPNPVFKQSRKYNSLFLTPIFCHHCYRKY